MYLTSGLHGQGTSSSPGGERRADGVHARHERLVGAEHLDSGAPMRVMIFMFTAT